MPHAVLLVDADAAARSARSEVLRHAGFRVVDAASGAEALKLVAEERPALAVIAVELPEMDGLEVCRRLKADPRTASIPVLHISSRGGPLGEPHRGYPESIESGADGWLREPVEPAALLAVATASIRAGSAAARTGKAEGDAPSNGRLAALIESIPDEVWFADAQGRFTLANPSAAREFGIGDFDPARCEGTGPEPRSVSRRWQPPPAGGGSAPARPARRDHSGPGYPSSGHLFMGSCGTGR